MTFPPLTPGSPPLSLAVTRDPAAPCLTRTLNRALAGLQPPNLIEMLLDRMERPA